MGNGISDSPNPEMLLDREGWESHLDADISRNIQNHGSPKHLPVEGGKLSSDKAVSSTKSFFVALVYGSVP